MRSLRWVAALTLLVGPACASLPVKPAAIVEVSGTVTDSSGRPLADTYVIFYPTRYTLSEFYGSGFAITDTTGAYSLQLIAATWDVYYSLPTDVVFSGGQRLSRVAISPEHPRVDLTIGGFRVEGRVMDPAGSGLDSGYVTANDHLRTHTRTRFRNGRFVLMLPGSVYDLVASSAAAEDGYPSRTVTGVPVHADTSFDIKLVGDPVTGFISGPGGAPLQGLLVTADGGDVIARARTGTDGRYTVYLPPGNYRFTCTPGPSDRYIMERIFPPRNVAGPATIDFDLSGVEWSGTVRSSATLLPLEGVWVRASLFADLFERSAFIKTNAAGEFGLVLEPQREYRLEFFGLDVTDLTYPGILATADSTFDVLLDPAPIP
jgi:hypothetical protein